MTKKHHEISASVRDVAEAVAKMFGGKIRSDELDYTYVVYDAAGTPLGTIAYTNMHTFYTYY